MTPTITAKTPRMDNHSVNTKPVRLKQKNAPVTFFPQTPPPVFALPAIQAADRRPSKVLPTPIAAHPSS
jgi:hypothetical protein